MEWDVFISHAGEDKEAFARPLANGLSDLGIKVWFDEFTLTVGDSLRRSIDQGLARSRFGIVVISKHFLQKEWPKKELDGLVAREVDGIKVILPVWHEIGVAEIRSYSPLLADRVAASSAKGLDHVIAELMRAIRRGHPTPAGDMGGFKLAEELAVSPTFKETQPKIGKALFFGDGEVLGRNKHGNTEFVMPFRSVFYLRVIPTKPLVRPLPVDLLMQNGERFGAFGTDSEAGVYIRENDYGVAILNPAVGSSTNIDSLTQYFRTGEIWGVNAEVLRQGERDNWLLSHGVEHNVGESLNFYLEFLREVSKIEPPYTVEAGLHGVKGRKLVNTGAIIGNARVFDDSFELRDVLHSTDLTTQDKFLLEFFELMHGQTGYSRPPGLYGFPPNRIATRSQPDGSPRTVSQKEPNWSANEISLGFHKLAREFYLREGRWPYRWELPPLGD